MESEEFRFKIRNPWRVFLVFSLVVLVLGTILTVGGEPLRGPSAPSGIVSFELAGDEDLSREIRCEWHWKGETQTAINNIWLDFLFIPAYVMTLLIAGLWASRQLAHRKMMGAKAALLFARMQPVAGALDIMENIALLLLLNERMEGALAFWAAVWATLKFLLVSLGFLTVLWAGFVRYALRIERKEG